MTPVSPPRIVRWQTSPTTRMTKNPKEMRPAYEASTRKLSFIQIHNTHTGPVSLNASDLWQTASKRTTSIIQGFNFIAMGDILQEYRFQKWAGQHFTIMHSRSRHLSNQTVTSIKSVGSPPQCRPNVAQYKYNNTQPMPAVEAERYDKVF